MSLAKSLALLFRRDLSRVIQQIEAFPEDEMLWRQFPGATNSAGNLTLHIEGNLREFIGRQIGGAPYERTRDLEFTSRGLPKQELIARVEKLRDTIPSIIAELSLERLAQDYPQIVLETPLSIEAFLIHLYGHLNWHLGQIDHLRRALSGNGAIARAGL